MDLDDDGKIDLVSGSYDPGDIYLFAGEGNGQFAAGTPLRDRNALNLVHHPTEFARFEKNKDNKDLTFDDTIQDRVASFGSWPALVDWECDGDWDILIGSFTGQVFLRLNRGTLVAPDFEPESVMLMTGNEPIKVHGHFSPAVADWNGDGLWDLLAGADDGSVGWFPNQGTKSEPKFGAYQTLISKKADVKFLEQTLGPGENPRPGVRAQIHVVDYDLDGQLDLLVGDYSQIKVTRELNTEERASQESVNAEYQSVGNQLQKLGYDEEVAKEREELMKRFFQLEEESKKIFHSVGTSSFVWVYLRKPKQSEVDSGHNVNQPHADQTPATPLKYEFDEPVSIEFPGSKLPLRASYRLGKTPPSETLQWRLEFQFKIDNGWHLYAATPPNAPGAPLKISLELPKHLASNGEWEKSMSILDLKNPGAEIYQKEVVWSMDITQTALTSEPADIIGVEMSLQICNDRLCLPPVTKTLQIFLPD